MTILDRELAGEPISPQDPDFYLISDKIEQAFEITHQLNQLAAKDPAKDPLLEHLFGQPLDETSQVLPPFYTDFGKNTRIGKNCWIQQGCTFFDRGGIRIEDDVFIGPKVNLITLNHVFTPSQRATTISRPIVVKKGAWIGINATILQGVTIGQHAIVGANSLVTKDVPDYAVVAGNPARIINYVDKEE